MDRCRPESSQIELIYRLDQWPPAAATAVLCAQWLVVLVPGLLVIGELVAEAQGLPAPRRVEFLQRLLIMSGLVQAGQVLYGHRLPGLVGPSAVLMVGILGSLAAGAPAVYGAMAAGGVIAALIGLTGLAARLGRIFTPPILATTLMLIAVTLAPSVLGLVFHPASKGGGFGSFLFAMAAVSAMFLGQHRLKGLWSSAAVFLGMLAAAAVYHLFGLGQAAPLSLPAAAISLPPLMPHSLNLPPGMVAAFCLFYLAVISNELATVETVGELIQSPGMQGRCNRAVFITGLGGVLAGLLGVPGPVTYSVSPGVAIASRSASRFTLLPTAGALVLLGLWPKGLALFGLVPPPVVGAVFFFVLASTVYAALLMLMSGGKANGSNAGIVVGAATVTGLLVTFMPEAAKESIPAFWRPLLANGFVAGLIFSLFLEHVIFRRK